MDMPTVADRTEILRLLSEAARGGHVPAMRLLLEELRHEGDGAVGPSVIDEIAAKRKGTSIIS